MSTSGSGTTTVEFAVIPTFAAPPVLRAGSGRVGFAYRTLAEAEAAAQEWRLRPYAHRGWPEPPDGTDRGRADDAGGRVVGLRIERHERTVHLRDDAVRPNTLAAAETWPRLVMSEGAGVHHTVHASVDVGGGTIIDDPLPTATALEAVQKFQEIVGAGTLSSARPWPVLRARAETARIETVAEWQMRGHRLEPVGRGGMEVDL